MGNRRLCSLARRQRAVGRRARPERRYDGASVREPYAERGHAWEIAMIRRWARLACLAALLLAAGCSGVQSVLDPKGPAASELAWLIWFFTGLCAAVWLLVMLAVA